MTRDNNANSTETYARVVIKRPGAKCNICLLQATLTEDHVPPKTCLETLDVELEPFEHRLRSTRPRLPYSQSGMRFKTICAACNNLLGADFDHELGALARRVRDWLRSPLVLSDRWTTHADPGRIIKSVFGHLLAADADDPDTVQDRQMRDYLLGRTIAPGDAVRVLYWLHDAPAVVVLRSVAMPAVRGHNGEVGIFSILKFPPLGFMVTTLDAYEGLPRLDPLITPSGSPVGIRVCKSLIRGPDWPERVDEGNFLIGGRSLRDARTARHRPSKKPKKR